jgi:DNA-binding MarR family transcriptional regulator
MTASPPDDGTAALGELVVGVARTLRRRFMGTLAPWDLSPHQARALRVVCARDGVRLSELAEALRIAPRSATEVADGLQERGLVARSADPADRRAVVLTPTPAGRQVQQEVDAARGADASELFTRLSADERTELARMLRRLTD